MVTTHSHKRKLEQLGNKKGYKFEGLIYEMYERNQQWKSLNVTPKSGDGGRDIEGVKPDGSTVWIECKHYSNKVPKSKTLTNRFKTAAESGVDEFWLVVYPGVQPSLEKQINRLNRKYTTNFTVRKDISTLITQNMNTKLLEVYAIQPKFDFWDFDCERTINTRLTMIGISNPSEILVKYIKKHSQPSKIFEVLEWLGGAEYKGYSEETWIDKNKSHIKSILEISMTCSFERKKPSLVERCKTPTPTNPLV